MSVTILTSKLCWHNKCRSILRFLSVCFIKILYLHFYCVSIYRLPGKIQTLYYSQNNTFHSELFAILSLKALLLIDTYSRLFENMGYGKSGETRVNSFEIEECVYIGCTLKNFHCNKILKFIGYKRTHTQ